MVSTISKTRIIFCMLLLSASFIKGMESDTKDKNSFNFSIFNLPKDALSPITKLPQGGRCIKATQGKNEVAIVQVQARDQVILNLEEYNGKKLAGLLSLMDVGNGTLLFNGDNKQVEHEKSFLRQCYADFKKSDFWKYGSDQKKTIENLDKKVEEFNSEVKKSSKLKLIIERNGFKQLGDFQVVSKNENSETKK